jgi:NDP-sugar pyrophosphorylase family protein
VSLPIVILAGGLATRLGPLTADRPKVLLEIGGRPFAEHQMDLLRREGLSEVIFCVGHHGALVEQALGDGSRWGMRFSFLHDGPTLLGTGGAVRRALALLDGAFFVMYGDSYLDCAFAPVEAAFRAAGKPGLMTVYRNDDQFDRSNVEFRRGQIVTYDKADRSPTMRHIDYGLGVLTTEAFHPWADAQGPFDLAAVYQYLVAHDALAGYEVTTRFYEIGSLQGLEDTRAFLAARAGAVT